MVTFALSFATVWARLLGAIVSRISFKACTLLFRRIAHPSSITGIFALKLLAIRACESWLALARAIHHACPSAPAVVRAALHGAILPIEAPHALALPRVCVADTMPRAVTWASLS